MTESAVPLIFHHQLCVCIIDLRSASSLAKLHTDVFVRSTSSSAPHLQAELFGRSSCQALITVMHITSSDLHTTERQESKL